MADYPCRQAFPRYIAVRLGSHINSILHYCRDETVVLSSHKKYTITGLDSIAEISIALREGGIILFRIIIIRVIQRQTANLCYPRVIPFREHGDNCPGNFTGNRAPAKASYKYGNFFCHYGLLNHSDTCCMPLAHKYAPLSTIQQAACGIPQT